MHSIYIRDLSRPEWQGKSLLATDIDNIAMGKLIVQKMARSFPDHGPTLYDGYWFHNKTGTHEIWCEVDRALGDPIEDRSQTLLSRVNALFCLESTCQSCEPDQHSVDMRSGQAA